MKTNRGGLSMPAANHQAPATQRRTVPPAAGVTMLLQSVLALEALHPSCRIDQTLLASVKRMTVRADLDVQFFCSRTGFKSVAAGARNNAAAIFGMDSGFHLPALIAGS